MIESSSPLISVIIPVFNAETFIQNALESVFEQTYKNLEIIVLDDGSTDSSKEIIESLEDKRIRFFSRENRGLIETLNEGINKSNGEYIARMDADDICLSTRFERQIKYLVKNRKAGVVFTGVENIDEKGKVLRSISSKKTRFIDPTELLFGCPVCHPTAMFDLTKIKKTELFYDHNYHLAEDFELWTRLISKTKIGLLEESLFKYRIHSKSITSQNGLKQRLVAVRAIKRNLVINSSHSTSSSLGVIYNNHLGKESTGKTLLSLFYVALNLKKLNVIFSYRKYILRTLHLIKKQLSKDRKLRK